MESAPSVKEEGFKADVQERRTVVVITLPEASVVVMTVPPLVLLEPEVLLDEPPIGEVELLPAPEVEFMDPPMAPPVGLAEPPVGARVVVMVEPWPSVVVTTAPPAGPPTVEVEVELSPVATTTVLVPLPDVTVAVLPPFMLAYPRRPRQSPQCSLGGVDVQLTCAEHGAKIGDSTSISRGWASLVGAVTDPKTKVLVIAEASHVGRAGTAE